MTDAKHLASSQSGEAAPAGPEPRPATPEPAALHDPAAGREANNSAGVESPGGGAGDPDALDQSVGRGDARQGDARTRNGAI
jgi:hypothetical protein